MKPFNVARLRLERAKSHGAKLAEMWNAIPAESLYSVHAQIEPDGTGYLRLTSEQPIPDEFSLLFGEMLYQLRSSLDACIYQATAYATNQYPPPDENRLEFPITSDSNEFPKLVKRRLSALPQDVQDGIERVQPYNMPALPPDALIKNINRSLGILNDLARKDRHRKLHVLGSWATDLTPQFILPEGVTVSSLKIMKTGFLEGTNELATYSLNGYKPGMHVVANPFLATTFGLNEPPLPISQNDTWGSRLTEIINAVSSVIRAMEQNF